MSCNKNKRINISTCLGLLVASLLGIYLIPFIISRHEKPSPNIMGGLSIVIWLALHIGFKIEGSRRGKRLTQIERIKMLFRYPYSLFTIAYLVIFGVITLLFILCSGSAG